MKRISPSITLIIISLLALFVALFAHLSGPRVVSVQLLPLSPERPQEQLMIAFTRPMQTEDFSEYFSLTPNIPGRMNWSEGRLYFTPEESLAANTSYTLTIKAGVGDIYGRKLAQDWNATFSLPEPSFVYLNENGQLTYGTLSGEQQVLTERKNIRQFIVDAKNQVVWYLHQPPNAAPTELWQLHLKTKKQAQFLQDKNFQIHSVGLAKHGAELVLLTQPIMATTNEALSVYRFDLNTMAFSSIELGELGLTLTALHLPHDGNTLLLTTLDGAQYLRTFIGEKMLALSKISTYRGSNRAGSLLVFEDIVPDKNYAGEIVLFDGGTKRITSDEDTLLMPTLSPDSTALAYSFQPRSAFAEQVVMAGEVLELAFELPVSGVRRQKIPSGELVWQHYEREKSYELPKFSPDGSLLSVEVFTKEQLQDLGQLRQYGEPNKPLLSELRFFDRQGKLLPQSFIGRELQWVDNSSSRELQMQRP